MRHLLVLLMLALASGAAGQLRVGGERELTPSVPGPAALMQFDAAIASDGDGFLGVWTDGSRGIAAMRFRADGSPFDAASFVVAPLGQGAAVAFGGGRYLVVWMGENLALFACFVGSDGSMSEPFPVSQRSAFRKPSVAFEGSRFLIAGAGFVVILDSDGRILATDIPLPLNGPVRIAAGSLAVDEDAKGISGAFPGGSRSFVIAAGDAREPRVAFDGRRWLVVWRRPDGTEGAYVDGSGRVSPPFTIDAGESVPQDLLWDGSSYLLLLGFQRFTFAAHIAPEQTSLPDSTLIASNAPAASVAWNGQRALALLERSGDIYAKVIPSAEPEVLVTISPALQDAPDAAGGLTVWEEETGASHVRTIFALLNGRRIELGSSGHFPHVAWNGEEWLVAWWAEGVGLVARRIAADGTLSDPILLQSDGITTEVAWDGEHWLVTTPRASAIFVTRLNRDGTRADAADLRLPFNAFFGTPALAVSPSGTLIAEGPLAAMLRRDGTLVGPFPTLPAATYGAAAWNGDHFALATLGGGIDVAIINEAGFVTSAAPPLFEPVDVFGSRLALAPAGDGFLLAWSDLRPLVHLQLLRGDGTPTAPPITFPGAHPSLDGGRVVYTRDLRVYTRTVEVETGPRRRAR